MSFQKRTKGLPPIPGVNIYIITPGNGGSPFILLKKGNLFLMESFKKRTKGLPLFPGVNIYILTPGMGGSPFVLFLKASIQKRL